MIVNNNLMLNKILQRGYAVLKTKTQSGPLPSMTQYFLTDEAGNKISYWNDVPIDFKGDCLNCSIQIPKELHGKFEMKKNVEFHPFMQDTRKNLFTKELELRFYAQFPLFNYGYIPQTWEQSIAKDQNGLYGDDDPLDICDLSEQSKYTGQIFQAKVLGSFCLIDQNQVDWKVLVIDERQSKQLNVTIFLEKINSVSDIDPRRIESIKNWFIGIKVFDGKKKNTIAFEGKIFNKEESLELIRKTHEDWKNLLSSNGAAEKNIREKYFIRS